jgi:peptide/nickel transport system substrate-binding protein
MERLQNPNNHASRAAQANLIDKMDVVDATTLVFTLKAKNAVFPQALALIPFIGSPKAIQEMGNDKFANSPVGAGPYILKSWQRDAQMVLTRNPNYWNAPRPYLDQLVIKPIQDETQRVNSFCAGQGNLVHMTSSANAERTQKDNCGVAQPLVLNGGINILFNMSKAPMTDARLRQAIAMAIDRADLSKVTTNGVIPPLQSIFRTDSPFYDPSLVQMQYNKTQAQTLFDQVAADNGGTVNIPIQSFGTGAYGAVGQYVQAVLGGYKNVKADLTINSTGAQVTTCTSRGYTGVCVFGNIFDDPEPTWTSLYTCASASNYTGYCNTKFDAAVADNQVTLDPKQRIQDIKDAQKQFYADVPAVFLQGAYTWMFSAPNVQDFHYANDGLPLIDRIWIKSH